jgi:signal recognition particle subunit SRP54
MLERLGSAIKGTMEKIAGAIFVDKKLIENIVKDLQKAMLEADINVKLVFEISEKIKRAAANEKIKGVEKKEHIIKILNDELLNIIGKEKKELTLGGKGKQDRILFVGLYGCGKTTTISKLALYYSKRGKKVAAIGLDVHRPAAPEQLEQLGKKVNIPVFVDKTEKNPIKIWKKFEKELGKFDLVLIDSAGRDAFSKELIEEIEKVTKEIKPTHTLLVMPADIGQAAKKQAEEFKRACNISGVIISRMDSSAKGGGALTACNEVNAPIYFIGTGEKPQDLEQFNPQSFISRMLGMGDLETLVEKVKSATDEKTQKKLQAKMKEGKFDLNDLYVQLDSMKNMGPLSGITKLIPGLGNKIPEELLGVQEDKLKKWKHSINSMTPKERENPELLEKQTTRLGRIAKGSGTTTSEIRALLKQYKIMKEFSKGGMEDMDLSKGMNQKQMMKLAKKFGKHIRI